MYAKRVYKLFVNSSGVMFIPLVNIVSDVLFTALDPHHLGNLRLVNKALAKSITKSVQDKSVAAALAKYRRLVVLPDNTVRIHSSLGKTVIDLILPDGEIRRAYNAILSMRYNGRLYNGRTVAFHNHRLTPYSLDISPRVFHASSGWLLKAKRVYVASITVLPATFDGLDTEVRVFVKREREPSCIFTLRFRAL